MLNKEIREILSECKERGWVMEPQAKEILRLSGVETTEFIWARDVQEAIRFANQIGYPVVAKVVSPEVVHKSDVGGVAVGVSGDEKLAEVYTEMGKIKGFSGIIVEEMVRGIELIVGMKLDQQFGPVVLLGVGGTAVEIYKDVALRMAPILERDVDSMLKSIKARPLLEGYRGSEPINIEALKKMLLAFSDMVMELGAEVDSIDLNPVICNASGCVVTDARMMLAK
ncbi:MAG: acetate--CoA ligase family protein [Proteobacteria bacterium]|nr:acetate--CoA ligase family protein [Pseudomonadota bacterium]